MGGGGRRGGGAMKEAWQMAKRGGQQAGSGAYAMGGW